MQVVVNRTENDIVDAYWDALRTLSMRAKLRLASLLTTAAFEEESQKEMPLSPSKGRIVKRRATNSPSDAQLKARFAGTNMPELPEDPSWDMVINANTGKTIKQIEKWL
ncbi:MAG: hypothetical protein IJV34_06300 [Prevotella sp.]|nr:hypothetical protein [Prevotella sp.]